MKQPIRRALALGLLLPLVALAQSDTPSPSAPPVAAPTVVEALPPGSAPAVPTPAPVVKTVKPQADSALPPEVRPAEPIPALAQPTKVSTKGEIRLNFQNASLPDVLNYLSEAAGFIIVQETPVSGTVNVISKQTVSAEDAVDLLNSVLLEKGYTALRNGRILKIVNRKDAQKQDLPVKSGSDPEQIPRKDGMVTQILPVRYVEAAKLVENLRPLLSTDATINANEASNSILLADTQTNIHRIAEIIHALDTSVSSISTIHVFQLQYADSKSLASVITQLFAADQNSTRGGGSGRGAFNPFAAMMGGGGGGGGGSGGRGGSTQGPAQQAATRVVAVSDDQSNSVIVSAPDAVMPTITEIVARIDTNIADITETRIFRLEHADSTELALVINSLYADTGTSSSSSNGGSQGGFGRFGGFMGGGGPGSPQTSSSNGRSQRALLQTRVVAVADPRTNSVVVSAARETLTQIALTVGRLDAVDAKKQKVYIHSLENADPDNVATILRGMFSSQGGNSSNTSAQPSSNQLNQRSSTGASSDITNILNTSGNSSSRSR